MVKLLGFGNAVVDFSVPLRADNPFYERLRQSRGGYMHTTEEEFAQMLSLVDAAAVKSCGGSVANSLKAYAKLGGDCGFGGKIGGDEAGRFFGEELAAYGIRDQMNVSAEEETGCTVVWVDEDGEKTVCAKRRASKYIRDRHIDLKEVINAGWLFVEGYWLDGNGAVVDMLLRLARVSGVKTAFTLSDPKIVAENRERLLQLMPYVTVLFGNEAEYAAADLPENAQPPLMLKTLGADGAECRSNGNIRRYAALGIEHPVSTTGAGDAFAGGFLYEYLKSRDIDKAVETGQECAAEVVSSEKSHL